MVLVNTFIQSETRLRRVLRTSQMGEAGRFQGFSISAVFGNIFLVFFFGWGGRSS